MVPYRTVLTIVDLSGFIPDSKSFFCILFTKQFENRIPLLKNSSKYAEPPNTLDMYAFIFYSTRTVLNKLFSFSIEKIEFNIPTKYVAYDYCDF